MIEYRLKQEIPTDLSRRLTILEERFKSDIQALKQDFSDAKSESKLKMAERLVYVTIIVGLVTTLITLKLTGRI